MGPLWVVLGLEPRPQFGRDRIRPNLIWPILLNRIWPDRIWPFFFFWWGGGCSLSGGGGGSGGGHGGTLEGGREGVEARKGGARTSSKTAGFTRQPEKSKRAHFSAPTKKMVASLRNVARTQKKVGPRPDRWGPQD